MWYLFGLTFLGGISVGGALGYAFAGARDPDPTTTQPASDSMYQPNYPAVGAIDDYWIKYGEKKPDPNDYWDTYGRPCPGHRH